MDLAQAILNKVSWNVSIVPCSILPKSVYI